MNKKDAVKGIWLITVNGEVYEEIYDEEIAVDRFENLLKDEDMTLSEIVLSRVLRTTKINEYPKMDTYGDWKVCPTIEGIEGG